MQSIQKIPETFSISFFFSFFGLNLLSPMPFMLMVHLSLDFAYMRLSQTQRAHSTLRATVRMTGALAEVHTVS